MGWTSYNKFGEVILSADTLDGFSSEDFLFKAGDVVLGNLGVELIGGNLYVKNPANNAQGHLTETALEFGVSGYDWSLARTAANVAQLGAGDKIRDTSDPLTGNDLARKFYVDSVLDAHVTDTGDAHDASAISYAGGPGTSATNVEGALDELSTEKADVTYVNSEIVSASATAMPTGTLLDFAGSAAPTGFLVCNGAEVSRTTYADLDSVIGTTFGAYTNGAGGAGTTHLRLPDFRGRTAVGAGTGAGDNAAGAAGSTPSGTALSARNRGAWGGGETHVLTPAQAPLRAHTHSGTTENDNIDHGHSGTTADINQNHTHSGSTGTVSSDHGHNFTFAAIDNTAVVAGVGGNRVVTISATGQGNTSGTQGITANHTHGFSTGTVSSGHTHNFSTGGRSAFHQHGFTTGNPSVAEANGTAHNNVQPFLVVNKIIKT